MKLKTLLLTCFIIFSCSKDEATNETTQSEENVSITGRLFAPNNLDPISNATVSAYKNDILEAQTKTDNQGNYTLLITPGDYNFELRKGKFYTLKTISITESTTIETSKLDILPKIGVVKGAYDNIESILYDMGLFNPITLEPLFDIIDDSGARISNTPHSNHHKHSDKASNNRINPNLDSNVDFSFGDLITDQSQLDTYDILFLNCGLSESHLSYSNNLSNYVNAGGILYATDWAYVYLDAITNQGNDYLNFVTPEHSGSSLTTEATILNGDLSAWLLLNYGISINDTVTIDEFLPAWQVVNSYDSSTCISWLNGDVTYYNGSTEVTENKDLAFTFLAGNGGVFYSSFHTENNEEGFSSVDRIMEYLVFEMSDIE
jgi:hypothetical protein